MTQDDSGKDPRDEDEKGGGEEGSCFVILRTLSVTVENERMRLGKSHRRGGGKRVDIRYSLQSLPMRGQKNHRGSHGGWRGGSMCNYRDVTSMNEVRLCPRRGRVILPAIWCRRV